MNGACLIESLVYYVTISCNDKKYKPKLYKGSCDTILKSTIVTKKNCADMIPSYQWSIGT